MQTRYRGRLKRTEEPSALSVSPPRQASVRMSEEQAEHVEAVRLRLGSGATTSDAVRSILDVHLAWSVAPPVGPRWTPEDDH